MIILLAQKKSGHWFFGQKMDLDVSNCTDFQWPLDSEISIGFFWVLDHFSKDRIKFQSMLKINESGCLIK